MDSHPLKISAGSRPHLAETENGDAWTMTWFADVCRVSIIDGLGHGPAAAFPAAMAVQTLEALGLVPPAEAIRRCHQALGGTRGVVMGVANIDLAKRSLNYAAVGNTDAVMCIGHEGRTKRLLSYRGIVGASLPTIRAEEVDLPESWKLLLYTDGVMDRFDLQDEMRAQAESPSWPDEFLERWGRSHDDATVILISPTEPSE